MNRYARQTILGEVGPEGQKRLAATHVLVVGAGGLGVPVLQYLAGAGVGSISIMDPDTVEIGNLHRQPLYSEADTGLMKASVGADKISAMNSEVQVTVRTEALDPETAPGLVRAADLVLDCADSFAAGYCLSDTCHANGTPLFSASVLGFEGYAGGFCGGAPSLRAVFPDLPDRAATCATAGVMGPVVATLGSLQAQMALNHLIGLTPSPLGQLVRFDGRTFRTSGFRFDHAPEPDGPTHRFLGRSQISGDDFVVDLRDMTEAPVPATADALRLSVGDFGAQGPRPKAGQRAVFCCRSGLRAWQAAERLSQTWSGEIALVAIGSPTEDSP